MTKILDISNVPYNVTITNKSKSARKVAIPKSRQTAIIEARGGQIKVRAANSGEVLEYLNQGTLGLTVVAQPAESSGGGGDFPEAPKNGKVYGRKDGDWVVVATELSLDELEQAVAKKANISDLGYLIVNDLTERDALLESVKEGTEIYVISLDASYRKRLGAWVQITSGGGSTGDVPLATKETAGIVLIGDYLLVDGNGRLSIDVADEVKAGDKRPVTSDAVYQHVDSQIVGPILNELSAI